MVTVTGWGVDLTYKSYNIYIYISTSSFPGPFQSDQGSSPEAQVFTAILRGLDSLFVIIAGQVRPQITMLFGWVEMDPQVVEKNAEKTPQKTKMILEKQLFHTFPMSS